MCLVLGLGLGESALDRISKRPNLNKRSNRKGRIRSNLNAVQTDTILSDVRDVCFRSKCKLRGLIRPNKIRPNK